jgi:CDP-paratose 2-epimerase
LRDILHIDDLFRLLDWQIHHMDEINGEIFNAGGGQSISVSLQELTEYCREATGNTIEIERVPANRAADIRIYVTDNSYVTLRTGWKPQIEPRQIIREIASWIEEHKKELGPILS